MSDGTNIIGTTSPDGLEFTGPDGIVWRKPERSGPNGNCPELAKQPNGKIAIRNSNNRLGGTAEFTVDEIRALFGDVSDGGYNYLLA